MVHALLCGRLALHCLCPSARYSPCSLPDHPISQLLKKLQCAVYSALYPAVSQGALSMASAPGADALLAPGGRRLRSSQSLYCMLSPPRVQRGSKAPGWTPCHAHHAPTQPWAPGQRSR